MGFNIYKQIPKIENHLQSKGYFKNIPVEEMQKSMFMLFGMKKETANKWIHTFCENKIISIKKGVLNFYE